MAEETETRHEPAPHEEAGDKKLFSKPWWHKHWVELAALGVGILGLLYLYLKSKSSSSSGVYSPPTAQGSPGAGTGSSGGGSGSSSPSVDLSPITDLLTQQASADQAFQQQLLQQEQANADAAAQNQASLLGELQTEAATLQNQNQQSQSAIAAAIAALGKIVSGQGGNGNASSNPIAPPTASVNPTLEVNPNPIAGVTNAVVNGVNYMTIQPGTQGLQPATTFSLPTASAPPPPPPPPATNPQQVMAAGSQQLQQARQGVKNLAGASPKPPLNPRGRNRSAATPL